MVYEPVYLVKPEATVAREVHISNVEGNPPVESDDKVSDQVIESNVKIPFWKHLSQYFPIITTLWFCGVFFLSIKLLGGWIYLHRLKNKGTEKVDSYWEERCRLIAKGLRLSKNYVLKFSHCVTTPLVIGFIRPVILLPVMAITGLPEKQIEAILAHELAHIKRHDYLINIFQSVMEVVFFYHPSVWVISDKIRKERENCCDDLSVVVTGQTMIYAEALLNIGYMENQQKLAVAFSGSNSNLKERIHRIFTPRTIIADFRERLITIIVVLLGASSLGMAILFQPEEKLVLAPKNEKESFEVQSLEISSKVPNGIDEIMQASTVNPPNKLTERKHLTPKHDEDNSPDPDKRDVSSENPSALIEAAIDGKFDKVKMLLKSGIDVNSVDDQGRSPLFWAVKNNDFALTQLLIREGADVQHTTRDGRSIIMEASDENDVRITELLLSKGAVVDYQTSQNPAAIFEAIENGNIAVVRALIKGGANLEVIDEKGRTPLLFAIDENEIKIAEMLIENGANVNASTESGWSVLMEASLRDTPELVKNLINRGASVNAISYYDHSAINGAVRRERLENAKLLILSGADVNWKYDGYTPLCEAVRRNNYLMTKLLIENGADPEIAENAKGETPLIMAASEKDPRIVELLIQQGASVNATRYDGRTALFEAIESGSIANAKILIENGADVNWDKYNDLTPLMYAIERENLNMVVLLVEHGADVNAKRLNGWSIIQIAQKSGHTQIINYLTSQANR